MKAIGDRMKQNYESRCKHLLTKRMPVVVRVDGKAFHTFTRATACRKPFDQGLINAMVAGAKAVASQMQGFKAAYIQSDEASFLMTDYDTFLTTGWFDYGQNKIESVSASIMTAAFNRHFNSHIDSQIDAHFDARAFSIPREDVSNYFLWRAMDWNRNSISMYCNAYYSHRDMHEKNKEQQHEMLHAKGRNWTTDLTMQQKNGTFLLKQKETSCLKELHNIHPNSEAIRWLLDPFVNCDREE